MDTRMITALYERLSRDDDLEGESNSISNQKRQLEDYARSQGFPNPVHFTDDGISGTCFDRPGFLAMMKEVDAGRVEYLLIKDMSRLGRDYLKVGQIMEILRQKGVRLIAINDGVDSARGDDDFTPFRNIMNEYYARDTSRKIRSTFQSKGKSGKHVTGLVIYGYLWNEARDQRLVDEYAAGIVKRIFAMTIEGMGPYQIASRLKEEKVLIPSAYLATHNEGVNKNKTFKDVYGWGSSTIVNILDKREYLGHTVNFKTRKHFKDKKSHYVPEDEWTIFENTHEAIIDQETFDLAQKVRSKVRRYPDGWGDVAPLTGLMYCADCGGKMYVHRFNNGKRISQYTCSQYSIAKGVDPMPNEKLEKLKHEQYVAERKLTAAKHKEKRLESEIKRLTRSERTHRLCTRAGMLETFLREPTILTDDDVMELLTFIFHSEAVQKKLNMLIENRKKMEQPNGS